MEEKIMEELLERIWMLKEEGKETTLMELEKLPLPHKENGGEIKELLAALVKMGLLNQAGEFYDFTVKGKAIAEEIIRRHRLAERLLKDVFLLAEEEVGSFVCEFEHILNPRVTDTICAFLGHPKECPHGKPIPRGKDCSHPQSLLSPLVAPLTEFSPGEEGEVAFICSARHLFLQQLSCLGINPGTPIKLIQKKPSFIIKLGESEIALEKDTASEIYLRRSSASAGSQLLK